MIKNELNPGLRGKESYEGLGMSFTGQISLHHLFAGDDYRPRNGHTGDTQEVLFWGILFLRKSRAVPNRASIDRKLAESIGQLM